MDIITENGLIYKVLSWKEREYSEVRAGTVYRHLMGIIDDWWLYWHKEYLVTVKSDDEDFERVFVLTEREWNDQRKHI